MEEIAATWLSEFALAVCSGDVAATVALFLPHGWLRDVLVFTWDTRSLEGHEKIASYLSNTLPSAQITNFRLDGQPGLRPEAALDTGVATGFTFETEDRRGHGYVYLLSDNSSGKWKALSVLMMLEDIKGHEELGPEPGVYGGHTLSWEEVNAARRAKIESNPHVVIIGGGQTGLHIAARFKQMDIPSIIVERNATIGDNWRMRYPTLSLHTTRNHHTFLYQPYPRNWPMWTPRDKVANWMQQYADSQDLVIWTNSHIVGKASYDSVSKTWNVAVNRDGTEVELHPRHIVMAVGILSTPRIPDIPGGHAFRGEVMHASKYMGGQPFAGKRTIVVGAANTSADICQDLAFRSAQSITMVQRSSTCVISIRTVESAMGSAYPDSMPLEVCDLKFSAMPLGLQRKLMKTQEALLWEREKDLHALLKKGGLKLNMGKDGTGQHFLVHERAGGIDVGCAELIGSGRVKVKQGVEIDRFTENGVVFTDGSELEADLVVFATGYGDPREDIKDIFGADVIDRTSPLWGMDEEGEIRGIFRPSGHPALWYGGGDFAISRFLSKQLALQIKAIELGMMSQ
ncbi:hypothetical protein AcW1_009664 [Taiwanofungus camphoratus]|nr:hypothetical protein AcV7_002544 [Antrodia cinnamomea]KAI0948059.1 hypothetical protein AcW1_009664 [Antrodia cinnamomea]